MAGLRVFIVGPARSGTSAMYYAMRQVLGLPGPGESHVIPAFQRVVHGFWMYCDSLRNNNGVLARRLDFGDFRRHTIDYIRNFYAATFPDGSFVDKTPGAEAIAGAQLIRLAFPDARIIVTRRAGPEVVQSYRRKFGSDFTDACRAWSVCMTAIEQMRPLVPDLLEVEQHDLATRTDAVTHQIAAYLGRPERAAELAAFFRDNRTDRLSDHDWNHRLTLDAMDWTEEQKQIFRTTCGPQMQRFGYPM